MSCCLSKGIPPFKKTKIVHMKSYRCRRTEASSHSKSGTKSKCDRNGVVRKKEKLCLGTTYLKVLLPNMQLNGAMYTIHKCYFSL